MHNRKICKKKVEKLDEEKRKKFQHKIVESIINKAKSLAEIQGTQYLGMMGDSGEKEMTSWIDSFFDEFEANMKEPEPKPKTPAKATGTSTTITKAGAEKNITHDVEEGFFGLEVKIDKKTVLSKDDFISKIYSENEGKEITFTWEDDKVEVIIRNKAEKKKKAPKVTQQELDNEEIQGIDDEETEGVDVDEENDAIQMEINEQSEEETEDDETEDETTEEETEEEEGLF